MEKIFILDGTVKMTENGLVLETADCLWPGTWTLGGVENENSGDKKADKLAKKQNKKVAKTLKKVGKADLQKMMVKLMACKLEVSLGSRDGYFSATKCGSQ